MADPFDDAPLGDDGVMDFEVALVGEDPAHELAEHPARPAFDEYPGPHLVYPAHRVRERERSDEMGGQ